MPRLEEIYKTYYKNLNEEMQIKFKGVLKEIEASGEISKLKEFDNKFTGVGVSDVSKIEEIIDGNVVKGVSENLSYQGGSNPNAKEIISERVNGLDLREHLINNKQLSSKKMAEIKSKIDNRTATKVEYEVYEWNKRFSARRREGVKQFWKQERERIIKGESTTRNWTIEQIQDILNGKIPKYESKSIQGHHSYSALKYPHLADKDEIIYPATPHEHLRGWHGGCYRNSIPGEPIIDIKDF